MSTKILIVDGDGETAGLVENSLTRSGNVVLKAKTGKEALELIRREQPDLVILEVNLPELDGYSVCKTLRAEGFKSPIIFLTSRTSEIDAVIGLELGAQDFIRKPIALNELLARIEVQLKKIEKESPNRIKVDELEIDLERRKVKFKGETKSLSHKEFQLLYALAQNPNKVFTRQELLNNVWGWSQYGKTRTVDIHMGYLRKKFEDNPRRPTMFQTIRGVGYTLSSHRE
ncbi:MAG: response regulator transcription factor [Candidatus Melainabacteria bacterium]|nr:response regulator transcription factor [Candidatus Melainabacteria bacterium]